MTQSKELTPNPQPPTPNPQLPTPNPQLPTPNPQSPTPNPQPPIITFLTDFGRRDGYVGAMHGVALSICPAATLVDLTHEIPPQDIHTAMFVLYQLLGYYPLNTVHCVVVDPGVGSERQAVAIRTNQGTFVGPDNGVFSLVLQHTAWHEAVALTNPAYQLSQASQTFHGRDIFTPAAAHLAAGVSLHEFGPVVSELVPFSLPRSNGPNRCRVMHIDHFGNLILDVTVGELPDPCQNYFQLNSWQVGPIQQTFADVGVGELVAYVGSTHGHVEIAVRNGHAAQRMAAQVGDEVVISSTPTAGR